MTSLNLPLTEKQILKINELGSNYWLQGSWQLNNNKTSGRELVTFVGKLKREKELLEEKLTKLKNKIEEKRRKEDELKRIKKMKQTTRKLEDCGNKSLVDHLLRYKEQLSLFVEMCVDIYERFPFSGKESHYQTALEYELKDLGYKVYPEVARPLHYYMKNSGIRIQLPHNITGREDLVLPDQKLLMELKQTSKITEKEKNQLCRYLEERKNNSEWGKDTRGLLINFGDVDFECYYAFYENGKIQMIRLFQKNKTAFNELVDSYEYEL
jgi:GxxExxY protein